MSCHKTLFHNNSCKENAEMLNHELPHSKLNVNAKQFNSISKFEKKPTDEHPFKMQFQRERDQSTKPNNSILVKNVNFENVSVLNKPNNYCEEHALFPGRENSKQMIWDKSTNQSITFKQTQNQECVPSHFSQPHFQTTYPLKQSPATSIHNISSTRTFPKNGGNGFSQIQNYPQFPFCENKAENAPSLIKKIQKELKNTKDFEFPDYIKEIQEPNNNHEESDMEENNFIIGRKESFRGNPKGSNEYYNH